ncbi:LysR family transcriptional regulator [Oceanospirillum sediminis]|uniref:LysR family transcriptional regulator n=1 Tax=Oceanospirillum sediminis TaxID=2760088 RepID=A0A839IUT0_9GAMM|nr:LysR family transcriptional regulator [Oceanospirillum sediminis]MBB1488711.1 LysR family transcriptional regulator [Oceanospirillum sediminis]
MDWRSINFDWNHARAFLVTAEEGSLSAAARALNTTQPTLGRQVTALEESLGVVLFERYGRGLTLTPAGLKLVEYVKNMSEAANQFSLAASGQTESVEGNVVISASEVTSAFILPELLEQLRTRYPGITLEIIATNETSDLRRREADIAIRAFRPQQPDLIARRLRDIAAGFYATPTFLQRLSSGNSAPDFHQATFLGFNHGDELIHLLNQLGIPVTQRNFPVICANHLVQWQMVKQHMGIGLMPLEVGDNDPDVQRAIPDLEELSVDCWLVAHRELRHNRRIRVIFDFLAQQLSDSDRMG